MADFFEFEADFVDSLRCIPMHVRLKLDTCIKLKLAQWNILVPQNVKPWLRSLAPLRAKLKHTENSPTAGSTT